MTDLEQKCNEYREYKRLAEQAEQMRDSLRDENNHDGRYAGGYGRRLQGDV